MAASRGEKDFRRMPAFAARLYDRMMSGPASSAHYADMARDLTAQGVGRRLLDVGTGPGRLLGEIRKLDDSVELHGLDLSSAMVDLATRKLDGQAVSLHAGSIRRTEFASDFFDVVTCAGSFYLWDEPAACLAEIHRILAPGGAAYLYETLRDCNRQAFEAALRDNLRREPLLRRLLAPRFLRKQLRMTYTAEEIRSIAAQTPFAGSATVTPISLGGLPVWARIELRRAKAS